MRTEYCGQLRLSHVGQQVTLCGWVNRRRDLGSLIFIDMRDREGIVQVFFDPDRADALKLASELRNEFCIQVTGTVRARDEKNINRDMATGEIEVLASSLTIINRADVLPLDSNHVNTEEARLKYRYLDLRRPEMAQRLKTRAKITSLVRRFMDDHGFLDIETPMLTKATPEGARDYLVPSRVHKGKFYALPQSPQLFKQLLMMSGFDRYYQIVKCFRDEDLRADRQPEFTQVDLEMSFIDMDGAICLLEDVLKDAFAHVGVELPTPLRRMPYWEAMDTYGCDKPDTRYGMHLVDLTDIFANSQFKVFATAANTEGQVVKCINAKGAGTWTRGEIDKLPKVAETFGAKGLAWIAFREDGSVNSPIVKFFSDEEMAALKERANVEPGDLVMFAACGRVLADEILGGMRTHMANALGIKREGHDFLWVVDFPMFKYDEEEKRYSAEHHPFTQPCYEDLDKIEDDPLSVGSYTYDFVMDGYEAGGGGIRIHNADLQMRVLKRLGFTEEQANAQFGYLIEALGYGAPTLGGFALGLDRVCMLLCGCDSIRDVMAFPKTSSGSDLMSAAPSEVSTKQLKEVSLRVL